MADNIADEIKKRLADNVPVERIKLDLVHKGFLESDINNMINKLTGSPVKKEEKSVHEGRFIAKEFFDRIGFGLASQQFINIFFLQTGASYFLIGLINGFKSLLSVITSSVFGDYSKKKDSTKLIITFSALVLAITILGLAYSRMFYSAVAFSVFLLLSGIFVVFYGDFYKKVVRANLKTGRRESFMRRISQYGLIVTGLSLLLGGYLLDKFPETGLSFTILGNTMNVYGYALVLGIAAASFAISLLLLASIDFSMKHVVVENRFWGQIAVYRHKIKETLPIFRSNKLLIFLLIATTLAAVAQTLGNTYYGIFIYEKLAHLGFGRYMNVAVVFFMAVLASLMGPYISQKNSRAYGKFPMLVFGTLLMAITPLTFYYNPNIVSISMGIIVGVIGAAISGVAQGLLTLDLVPENVRSSYFSTVGFFVTIPYLITIPVGSYIAQAFGFKMLFLILGLLLAAVVVPIYLVILLFYKK